MVEHQICLFCHKIDTKLHTDIKTKKFTAWTY